MRKTIQDDKWVHAAVLDFSKAFDVLGKLQYYGIRAPCLTGLNRSSQAALSQLSVLANVPTLRH